MKYIVVNEMPEVGLVAEFKRNGSPNENHTVHVHLKIGEKPLSRKSQCKAFIPLKEEQATRVRRFVHKLAAERKANPFDTSSPNELPSDIQLTILPGEQKIKWFQFFPFGHAEERPLRAGIGSLIHHTITEWLAAQNSHRGFSIEHSHVTSLRKVHLNAMEINPERAYPIEEYRKLVRAFVEKKFGKGVKVHLL